MFLVIRILFRHASKQNSVIDYIVTDMQMLKKSGKLCVDRTDIWNFRSLLSLVGIRTFNKTSY